MTLDKPITIYPHPYSDQQGNTITPTPIILTELDATYHINIKQKTVYATIPNIPHSIILANPSNFDVVSMITPLALENTLREKLGENPQAFLQNLFPRTLESDPNGPGTILAGMLSALGIRSAPNCACKRRAIQMNTEGPDWCEQNMDTILSWLKEESEKRKLPFIESIAKLIVQRAISKSRRLLSKK